MLIGSKPYRFDKDYTTYPVREIDKSILFSLVMRTQGNRLSLLREALASVWAQTEKRYEVLLCVHSSPDAEPLVQAVVDEFPDDFSQRVRLVSVQGGGRCRPLNEAIERINGRFICFLDDDDLLLDNHFSSLAAEIESNPYQHALHTFGALRKVQVIGGDAYTTAGVQLSYTLPFSFPLQMIENSVPICNIFVSTELIDTYQLRFDESFEVLEDWQFLMEVNRYAGVATVPVVTTVVNMRTDASNTTNDPALKELWDETRARHQSQLAESFRLLNEAELSDLLRLMKYFWGYTHNPIYGKALALEPFVNLIEKTVPKKVLRRMRKRFRT